MFRVAHAVIHTVYMYMYGSVMRMYMYVYMYVYICMYGDVRIRVWQYTPCVAVYTMYGSIHACMAVYVYMYSTHCQSNFSRNLQIANILDANSVKHAKFGKVPTKDML